MGRADNTVTAAPAALRVELDTLALRDAFATEIADVNRRRLRVIGPIMVMVHVVHAWLFWAAAAQRGTLTDPLIRALGRLAIIHCAMVPLAIVEPTSVAFLATMPTCGTITAVGIALVAVLYVARRREQPPPRPGISPRQRARATICRPTEGVVLRPARQSAQDRSVPPHMATCRGPRPHAWTARTEARASCALVPRGKAGGSRGFGYAVHTRQ